MAQYYQPRHDDSVVLTPARRGAEDGDTAVYVIPVAEALPPSKASKRPRQERGASIATLDAEDDSAWTQTLFGGGCAASPTYWLRTLLCPCATAAAVNERLGSSFELALLYFGVLASGMFVCTGLAITYDQTNPHHRHGDRDGDGDGFPHDNDMGGGWPDRNSSSFGGGSWPPPPPHDRDEVSLGKNPEFWAGVAVACVLLFLLGVWLLRDQTRKRLSLRGTKLGDLVVSSACCCCALGQMDLELRQSKLASKRKKERRQEQQQQQRAEQDAALPVVTVEPEAAARYPRHEAADTLAAYPAGALV